MDTGSRLYLVALPCFPDATGFNHQTVLVRATDKEDARRAARHLRPQDHIGDIKQVNYPNAFKGEFASWTNVS